MGGQVRPRTDFSTEPSALIATAVWATAAMTRAYATINPAAVQREIQALTAELLTITTAKAAARTKPDVAKRATSDEATTRRSRAS